MGFILVLAMTASELFGNAHLKWYADNGRGHHLALGLLAWLLTLAILIKVFMKGKSMMWTCIMWEAMIVLGGMGNIWGVAIGGFVIFVVQQVFLPQLTNFFNVVQVPIISDIDFVQYQYLLYGIALVVMMLFRPEGLFPNVRRRRELHTATAGSEEMVSPDEAAPEVE